MKKYAVITDQVCDLSPSEKVAGHRTSDVLEANPWSSGDGACSLDNCTKNPSATSPPLTSQQVMAINLIKSRLEHEAKPPPKRVFYYATFTHMYQSSGSDGDPLSESHHSWTKPHK